MDYDRQPHHSSMNGVRHPMDNCQNQLDKRRRNYKLIVDPSIHSYMGNQKVYRFDGVNLDGHVVEVRDPRPRYHRIWCSRKPADLPVPQFKYDQNYVGVPPPKEITLTNLNDNINRDFLANMCKGFGTMEEVKVYYHPKTKKHIGIGKVVFATTKAAKICVEKLNRTSKMGNIMNVFIDTFGTERGKLVERKVVEPVKVEVLSQVKRHRVSSLSNVASCDALQTTDGDNEYNSSRPEHGGSLCANSNSSFSVDGGLLSAESFPSNLDSQYTPSEYLYGGETGHSSTNDYSSNSNPYQQQQCQQPSQDPFHRLSQHPSHPPQHPSHPPQHPSHHQQHPSHHHQHPSHHQQHPSHHQQHPSHHQQLPSHHPQHPSHHPQHPSHPPQHPSHPPQHQSHPPQYTSHQPEHPLHPSQLASHHTSHHSSIHSSLHSSYHSSHKTCPTPHPSPHHPYNYSHSASSQNDMLPVTHHRPQYKDGFPTFDPNVPPPPLLSVNPPVSSTPAGDLYGPTDFSNMDTSGHAESTPDCRHSDSCSVNEIYTGRLSGGGGEHSKDNVDGVKKKDTCHLPTVSVAGMNGSGTPAVLSSTDENLTGSPCTEVHVPSSAATERQHAEDSLSSTLKSGAAGEGKRVMSLESRIQSLLLVSLREDDQQGGSGGGAAIVPPGWGGELSDSRRSPPADCTLPETVRRSGDGVATATDSGRCGNDVLSMSASINAVASGSDMDLDEDDDVRVSLSPVRHADGCPQAGLPCFDGSMLSNGAFASWPLNAAGPYGGGSGCFPTQVQLPCAASLNRPADTPDPSIQLVAELQRCEEVKMRQDCRFTIVLESFVKELKLVMQNDLCKKMVEVSAFKLLESWWDGEERQFKHSANQALPDSVSEAVVKSSSAVRATDRMNSAIASLFDSRHPWTADDGHMETAYGADSCGGLLGIRGGMSHLPSFKKKLYSSSLMSEKQAPVGWQEQVDARPYDPLSGGVQREEYETPKATAGGRRVIYSSDSEEWDVAEKPQSVSDGDDDEDDEEEEEESEEDSDDGVESEGSVLEDSEDEEEEKVDEEERVQILAEKHRPEMTLSDSASDSTPLEQEDGDGDDFNDEYEPAEGNNEEDGLVEGSASDQALEEFVSAGDVLCAEGLSYVDRKLSRIQTSDEVTSNAPSPRNRSCLSSLVTVGSGDCGDGGQKIAIDDPVEFDVSDFGESMYTDSVIDIVGQIRDESQTSLSMHSVARPSREVNVCVAGTTGEGNQISMLVDQKSSLPSELTSVLSHSAHLSTPVSQQASSALSADESFPHVTSSRHPVPSASNVVLETAERQMAAISSSDLIDPYVNPAIAEHDYFAAPTKGRTHDMCADSDSEQTDSADELSSVTKPGDFYHCVWLDHNYCSAVPRPSAVQVIAAEEDRHAESISSAGVQPSLDVVGRLSPDAGGTAKSRKKKKSRLPSTHQNADPVAEKAEKDRVMSGTLKDVTNRGRRELANLLSETYKPKAAVKFNRRNLQQERQVFFDIYNKGIDDEDISYLKRTYDDLMQSEDPMFYWLNDILWVEHPLTDIPDPPRKRRKLDDCFQNRKQRTGSVRTDGYFKVTLQEKARYLSQARSMYLAAENFCQSEQRVEDGCMKKTSQTSREMRQETRHLQLTFSEYQDLGDLFKFNKLKARKKLLRFAKSGIHDWGLFALEPILADEMVIEYVGAVVRQSVADLREKQYERSGIGSSYLFRVGHDRIIDATMMGNLARFINHSCSPNCYAKVITMESHKKIVIYSKRDIDVNEEITYDYKFPIEDKKIPCLCGTQTCRGTLN